MLTSSLHASTLKLSFRRAANAILPQNSCIVHKGQLKLGLQVKVLPAANGHGRVEDVGHKQWDAQGDVGLDKVQNLIWTK